MAKDADLHFADQSVIVANVLFFGESQAAELLKVMMGYAGAAEV